MKANCRRASLLIFSFILSLLIPVFSATAFEFPAAGWHRGDVSLAQENSRVAVLKALNSVNPHIEVDILDFVDKDGKRVGLVSHDYLMKRATGQDGAFSVKYNDVAALPQNQANSKLQPEPFMTVIDLFEMIKKRKEQGVTPNVSLDMKDEGKNAEEFGKWVGKLIQQYDFQKHVFASSFYKSNAFAIKEACPECLVGGLVFNDHFALKHLDYKYTSLDLTTLSELTYFMGFWGKEKFNHDFVLIQDDIFFKNPEIVDFWKKERGAKFVGVFVYSKETGYTKEEWELLKKLDWMELDPPQMNQYLEMKKGQ